MSLYSKFKVNESRALSGVWLTVDDSNPDALVRMRLAMAHDSNPNYKRISEQVYRPHGKALENDALSAGLKKDLFLEAIAKACVVEWENVTDEFGVTLECTSENVIKVFTDLPLLFEDVLKIVIDRDQYVGTFDTEDAIKN